MTVRHAPSFPVYVMITCFKFSQLCVAVWIVVFLFFLIKVFSVFRLCVHDETQQYPISLWFVPMMWTWKMTELLAACQLTNWSLKGNSYPFSWSKLCFSNKFHNSKLESFRNFNYHLHTNKSKNKPMSKSCDIQCTTLVEILEGQFFIFRKELIGLCYKYPTHTTVF